MQKKLMALQGNGPQGDAVDALKKTKKLHQRKGYLLTSIKEVLSVAVIVHYREL